VSALLDTHVILWWFGDPARLSRPVQAEIETSDHLLVSPISCWEIAVLAERERIRLDRPIGQWVTDLLAIEQVEIAPLSAVAAAWAGQLGDTFPRDPADRLIYATARDLRVPLLTKDEQLRRYAGTARDVRVLW